MNSGNTKTIRILFKNEREYYLFINLSPFNTRDSKNVRLLFTLISDYDCYQDNTYIFNNRDMCTVKDVETKLYIILLPLQKIKLRAIFDKLNNKHAPIVVKRAEVVDHFHNEKRIQQVVKDEEDEEYDDNIKESILCCVCMEREKKIVFLPCCHMCTCATCAKIQFNFGSGSCPVCRQVIDDLIFPIK